MNTDASVVIGSGFAVSRRPGTTAQSDRPAQAPPQSRPIVSQSDSLGVEDSVGEKSREDPSDPGGEPRRARLEFRIGRAAAAHLRRRAAADGDQRHRALDGAGAGRPAGPPGADLCGARRRSARKAAPRRREPHRIDVVDPGNPPPRVYGAMPRPYAPYEMPWMGPDFRPPGMIGRADPDQPYPPVPRSRPASQGDKPEPKAAAAPASPHASVVTIGPSAGSRAADPKPTGSTPKAPSFPPVQSLE